MNEQDQVLQWGREVLEIESAAVMAAAKNINASFGKAVDIIFSCSGKVIVSGVGKSGHIGAKLAATFASTGTPSFFLHPAEGVHGDFGMLSKADCLLVLTHSGETREILEIVDFAQTLGVKIIAISGKSNSTLAKRVDSLLLAEIDTEADSLRLAPTSSTTVALAMGDALAVALMRKRGFSEEDFASLHPRGSLGRSLSRIRSYMQKIDKMPVLHMASNFHDVLQSVTQPNFGIAAVLDADNKLIGGITDGDLRRALVEHGARALEMKAGHLMNASPKWIGEEARAYEAIALMEKYSITSLFVMSSDGKDLKGLLRLHDLLASHIL